MPFKDYTTNTVVSTPLQIADGTIIVFDETRMREGGLNATGTANARALQEIVDKQQVQYDFQYYQLPMPMDAPSIVLSKTKCGNMWKILYKLLQTMFPLLINAPI